MSSYRSRTSQPDFCGLLLTLKEILESVLEQMAEDDRFSVRPDISFLEAADTLEQQLNAIRQDLGL